MLTVGVDLAAEPINTAVAWLEWESGSCAVRRLEIGADDALVIDAITTADKAGIDCPLGWPMPFVEFVTAHQAGHVDIPTDLTGRAWRRNLALRLTDQDVHARIGLRPLSVSTDRIGHAAMRCAALMAGLAHAGRPVDRAGRGAVVEVYPAASLIQWELRHQGYKRRAGLMALGHLVDELQVKAPWLDLGPHESACRHHHDAIDAVIAALTARAAAQGLTTTPDNDQTNTAAAEGWIALPTRPLRDLQP